VSGADQLFGHKHSDTDRSSFTGLVALAATTMMLMAALTSAYVVRRGLSNDWMPVPLPFVFSASVPVLIVSALLIEIGRRRCRSGRPYGIVWLAGTAAAIGFVLLQVYTWVLVSTTAKPNAGNPAVSFFYVLTGTFVVFVCGAMAALTWVAARVKGSEGRYSQAKLTAGVFYWYFLVALWICLVILFYFVR
jgi:heme/copper-type cytochrome/quinol oxidase subunit 3